MKYIAYGSNINLRQMKNRCPHSKVYGKGYLKGWKLVFNVHADIIPTKNEKDIVPVLIWDIDNRDWSSLDRYEGYPIYYVKQKIKTQFENGENHFCIAYVMAEDKKGFELPWNQYYNTIAFGYKENNIPQHYLHNAILYTEEKERMGWGK